VKERAALAFVGNESSHLWKGVTGKPQGDAGRQIDSLFRQLGEQPSAQREVRNALAERNRVWHADNVNGRTSRVGGHAIPLRDLGGRFPGIVC
jgi:hypothetical protein